MNGPNTTLDSSLSTSTQLTSDSATTALSVLQEWADKGWLRRLDCAMAAFMLELDPAASPTLLISAAVLTQVEGRGHTCLPLNSLVVQPAEILAWPQQAQEEIQALWQDLPRELSAWLSALRSSTLVRLAEDAADHGQPLVLAGSEEAPLLYLRRFWLHEKYVAHAIRQRCLDKHVVDEPLVARWLDQLFQSPSAIAGEKVEPDWQKVACAVALRAGITVITGGPGTGKTYTAARLLALLFATSAEPARLRVTLAAPTGKAAARLRQSIDTSLQDLSQRLGTALDLGALTQRMGAAKTLHSLLGASVDTRAFRFNASNLLDVDILIVDEASMVNLEMMSALLKALPSNARLILLGDKDQLASVEAGAVLGDLCRDAIDGHYSPETGRYVTATSGQVLPIKYLAASSQISPLKQQTVMLRKSRRFGGVIGQLAQAVNEGESANAQALLDGDTTGILQSQRRTKVDALLTLAVKGREGATASCGDYLRAITDRAQESLADLSAHEVWVKTVLTAYDRFRILCAVHEGEWGTHAVNLSVQRALERAGLLKPKGEWFVGRPVMVTRNDHALGVFNGDVGVTLPGPPGSSSMRVYFLDGEKLRSVGVSRLANVETAFAMTVHKSQGSEFFHTVLVLPPGGGKVLTKALVYTGITRAKANLTLFEPQDGVFRSAIDNPSMRVSGLEAALSRSSP